MELDKACGLRETKRILLGRLSEKLMYIFEMYCRELKYTGKNKEFSRVNIQIEFSQIGKN